MPDEMVVPPVNVLAHGLGGKVGRNPGTRWRGSVK